MEFEFWEIILRHLQHVAGIGHEYVAAVAIGSHELVFSLFESIESLFVIAFDPACLVHRQRLPAALCAILV